MGGGGGAGGEGEGGRGRGGTLPIRGERWRGCKSHHTSSCREQQPFSTDSLPSLLTIRYRLDYPSVSVLRGSHLRHRHIVSQSKDSAIPVSIYIPNGTEQITCHTRLYHRDKLQSPNLLKRTTQIPSASHPRQPSSPPFLPIPLVRICQNENNPLLVPE